MDYIFYSVHRIQGNGYQLGLIALEIESIDENPTGIQFGILLWVFVIICGNPPVFDKGPLSFSSLEDPHLFDGEEIDTKISCFDLEPSIFCLTFCNEGSFFFGTLFFFRRQ